jgi:hypothetical protein
MVGAGVGFALAACAYNVARAILRVAEKGAASLDALMLVRLSRVKR